MPHALWLLIRLRLNGWFRRIGVRMNTAKGAFLTIVSALIVLGWLSTMVFSAMVSARSGVDAETLTYIERFAPFALLAYCLLSILTTTGQAPVSFSLAEVQFLFSAPFSRRQLLAYKLISQFLLTLPFGLFMTISLRNLSGGFLSSFLGVILILIFIQLFTMTVSFVAGVIGELAYSRTRKIVIGFVAVVVVAAVAQVLARAGPPADYLGTLEQIEKSAAVQITLTPFRCFVRVVTATKLWPDLLQWSAVALAVDLVFLALVFLLDASYLESSATASEKRYARLQRIRSGGIAGATASSAGKARFRIPDLPWLGGAGPVAWRQLVAAARGYRAMTFFLIFIAIACIGPAIAYFAEGKADESVPWSLSGIALVMTALMNQFFAFDFRSDVDRIEVLKSLPIASWRIALGQLIVPAVFISLFQIFVIALIYLAFGAIGYLLVGVMVFAWPVNLMLVGIDNVLFLLFPTRTGQPNAGDLSQAGRQMLLMLARVTALSVGVGIPIGIGAIVFFLSGQSWIAAGIAAWLPCVAVSFGPVPLVAWTFRRFDVARDTPP